MAHVIEVVVTKIYVVTVEDGTPKQMKQAAKVLVENGSVEAYMTTEQAFIRDLEVASK